MRLEGNNGDRLEGSSMKTDDVQKLISRGFTRCVQSRCLPDLQSV